MAEIRAVVDGSLHGDPTLAVDGADIDSRSVKPGSLFVPIVADRDGHTFIDAARSNGASAHLCHRTDGNARGLEPYVLVTDTTVALQQLGRAARQRIGGATIGVTGSVGKTSTKDLLAAALGADVAVHASHRSFNNELGVPLTLINAPDGTEVAVVEMGARGIGHIAELCAIATPTIGVVTVVAGAHTELFGDIEAVAVAKGELVEALPASGTAVLNATDHRVAAMAQRTSASVVTFNGPNADVRASEVTLDADLRPSFQLDTPWGSAPVRLRAAGGHMVVNALAAVAAAGSAGASLDGIVHGLNTAEMSPLRMDLQRLDSGVTILNDAYNANPTSMRAALASLLALDATDRVAVLGVMAELGAEHDEEHRRIGDEARAGGIEVVAVGVAEYGGTLVADAAEAIGYLETRGIGPGTAVLVKGSRVAELEIVAASLSGASGASGSAGR